MRDLVSERQVRGAGCADRLRRARLSGFRCPGEDGMREIDDGSIEDPDDELLGVLLKSLYPRVLSMVEVRKYLREPKLKATVGEYSRFWTDHVPRESRPEQLAELLDGITANFEELRRLSR